MDKLNIKEAAEYVRVSEKTLRRWVKKEKVKPETENGEYRFLKTELEPFRPAEQKQPATEQGTEKKPEARQQEPEQAKAPKAAKAPPDTTKILIDSLTGTMAVLKDQLAVKDTQMAAKDSQILKLMDAQERSDILLKGLQDRVRQLEAPGSRTEYDRHENADHTEDQRKEELSRGLDADKEDVHVDVQPHVQPNEKDVQTEKQGSHEEQDTVDGDFEEADQASPADVPLPKPENVQSDVLASAGNRVQETEEHEEEQGSEPPKKGLFSRLFSRN